MGKTGPRKAQTRSQIEKILIYEYQFLKRDLQIACVDEVGRGALAGPVVASAILIKDIATFYEKELKFIHGDSKKLCENSRFWAFDIIKKYFEFGIGMASNQEIDELGIVNATKLAMDRAIHQINNFDIVLSDFVNLEQYECIPITKGDEKSFCIRLTSLLAKAHRDSLMIEYENMYKNFSFSKHKGYGTKEHISEIKTFGISNIHRKSFCYNIIDFKEVL